MGTVPACLSRGRRPPPSSPPVGGLRLLVADVARGARRLSLGDRRRARRAASRRSRRRSPRSWGCRLKLSQMIQVGLPTSQFRGDAGADGGKSPGRRQIGNSRGAARSRVGRARRDHPLELPAEPDRRQGRPPPSPPAARSSSKPSEVTPLNAFLLAEVIEARRPARRPSSTSSPGSGRFVGEAIAAPPGRRHGFLHRPPPAPASGSASWPRPTVKPVAMELGGKSAET